MRRFFSTFIITLCFLNISAQPQPGDWFREYTWIMPDLKGNEKFLRVGGRFDYRQQTPEFEAGHYVDGNILIPQDVNIKNAIKVEIMVEKNLCHDYTTGLSVSLNDNTFIEFPEAEGIPEPQEGYMHHNYPIVSIPLEQIKKGKNNYFKLKVDSFQHWGWPQNLVYGLTLRVYYDHKTEKLPEMSVPDEWRIKAFQELSINYYDPENIEQVDYIASYEGPDMNGDGIFTGWHYGWFMGEIRYHIGTSGSYPFNYNWNTEWLPDQNDGISLAARIKFKENDLIYFTEAIHDLQLERPWKVKFCTPYNIPQLWTTRNQEYSSMFYFDGEVENIEKVKIVWRSWSPGYMNGLYLNDLLVMKREGDRYTYHDHELIIEDRHVLSILNKGTNSIKTGKTPLYNQQMVHGMDVFYPGPMIMIKTVALEKDSNNSK